MALAMKSVAINAASAVTVDFGEYEKVKGAHATPGGSAPNAVGTKIGISGITVTVTPSGDAGAGDYYVLADCI